MNKSDKIFEVFSYSVTKSGKQKCGDAFLVHDLIDENLIVLAVADGVSSRPCDWLASKTACETIVSVFSEIKGSIPERMKIAAAKANSIIRQETSACRGMLTSLSLAVWDIGNDEIHFLNVGDSRIYVGTENDLRQITVDDVIGVLIKKDGEVLLEAGMPVFKRGVTRSLGQNEPLVFEVQTNQFLNKDLLVLVSDGICKNEAFTSELADIFASGTFFEKLKQFVRKNSEKNKDDATLVVLWRTERDDTYRADFEACLIEKLDFREKNLSAQMVLEFLQSELLEKLSLNNNEKVDEILDYAAQFGLKFSKTFLSGFLSSIIKQGTDRNLVARARDLIRVSVD